MYRILTLVVATLTLIGCAPASLTTEPVPTSTVRLMTAPPTASLAPMAHTLAIAALVEEVTGGKFTYRVAFKGKVSVSVDTLPIAGSMDVSGADFATSFTYDFSRDYQGVGKIRVQVRAVKGKGYIKRASTAWKAIKGYDEGDSYVPFKSVKVIEDVRYLGPVKRDGKTFHKVSIPAAMLIHPNTIPYQIQKEKIDDVTLEIVLDDAGRPRSGTWNLRGQARVGPSGGQLQRVVYDLDLTFSKVGAKLAIKRP